MERKFELTDISTVVEQRTVHRIRALRDFSNVKKGDIGGYVESENNLSQKGNCWIYDDAIAMNDSLVQDNAIMRFHSIIKDFVILKDNAEMRNRSSANGSCYIRDFAKLCGSAKIMVNVDVSGNSRVSDWAEIMGKFQIKDHARVQGSASIKGKGIIGGHSLVCGNADVEGMCTITDNAIVRGDTYISDGIIKDNAIVEGIGYDVDICSGEIIAKNAKLTNQRDLIMLTAPDPNEGCMTFYRTVDADIYVCSLEKKDPMRLSDFKEYIRKNKKGKILSQYKDLFRVVDIYLEPKNT